MLTDSASLTLADGAMLIGLESILIQDVTVQQGSTLSAQGRVQGDLVNDGEVDMGSTVGATVVSGNYTQGANAILTVKVNGPFAGDADQLFVVGTATLDGTLNAVLMNGFTLSPTRRCQS